MKSNLLSSEFLNKVWHLLLFLIPDSYAGARIIVLSTTYSGFADLHAVVLFYSRVAERSKSRIGGLGIDVLSLQFILVGISSRFSRPIWMVRYLPVFRQSRAVQGTCAALNSGLSRTKFEVQNPFIKILCFWISILVGECEITCSVFVVEVSRTNNLRLKTLVS